MKDTRKQLTALNSDSIRELINEINEREIKKEDILFPIFNKDSIYLLYYEDCD